MEISFQKLPRFGSSSGFALSELLAVLVVVVVLGALLYPIVTRSREAAMQAQCANNLRQLYLANTLYAGEYGMYVPAAPEINGEDSWRWHGSRSKGRGPFLPAVSPLSSYLGQSGRIQPCPAIGVFSPDGLEKGCGGYGYNVYGVGSRAFMGDSGDLMANAMKPKEILKPDETIMFADAAVPVGSGKKAPLIECAFLGIHQPPAGTGAERIDPAGASIHFRHKGRASVVWCDGRVTHEKMTHSSDDRRESMQIGWFGEKSDRLFDPL
ncbi:MAG: DUF1559 domain-containing protein [Verrucomicrobia bacterium]|nr:DUF1559 domain-containing protein [Verrucomicrobiota bacterium]